MSASERSISFGKPWVHSRSGSSSVELVHMRYYTPLRPCKCYRYTHYISGSRLTELSHCHLCSHVRVAFDSRLPEGVQGKTSVSNG